MSLSGSTESSSRTATRANRRVQPAVGLLLAAVAVSSVAGCGGRGVHAQPGPAPSPNVTVDSAPSPSHQRTERQRAATAAVAQMNRYERLVDDLSLHPRLSLNRLYLVSTEPNVTDEIAFLNHFRSDHDRQAGRVRVMSVRVEDVKLNIGHDGGSRRPTVELAACLDVSNVRAIGPSGHSIVPKTRKPYYLAHLQLVNVKYPDSRSWRVQKVSATEERTCSV